MAWWTLIVPTACWQQLMFLFIVIFLVILALLSGWGAVEVGISCFLVFLSF